MPDGSTTVYVTQNNLQQVSVYEIERESPDSPPVATFIGVLTSDFYDDPTTSVVLGDRLYSVNGRFTSLGFPADGEGDLTTFDEVFTMVSVDRMNYTSDAVATMAPTATSMTSAPASAATNSFSDGEVGAGERDSWRVFKNR